MATEDNQNDNTNTPNSEENTDNQKDTNQDSPKYESLDDALARIEQLEGIKKDLIGQRDEVKTKLRTFEEKQQAEEQEQLEQQGEYKQLLEAEREKLTTLQQRLRQNNIDSAIDSALKDGGLDGDAFNTARKVIDVSSIDYDEEKGVDGESIKKAIDNLKTEHPILFQSKPKTPEVKRTTGSVEGSDYHTELQKLMETGTCTKQKIRDLKKRFNKS